MSTLYPGGDYPVTPNLGLALWDMSFEMAENMILIDTAVGSGSSVQINGSVIANPNFNNTTPAAPAGKSNVLWQVSGSSVSAYVDSASVQVNGSVVSSPNFNGTLPAAPTAGIQAVWQSDVSGNISSYITIPSTLHVPATTTLAPNSGSTVTLQAPNDNSVLIAAPSMLSGDASLILSAGLAGLNGGIGGGVYLNDPNGGGIVLNTAAAVSVTDTVGSLWNGAAGGSQGAGTINALGLYVNGVAVVTGSSLWSGLGNAAADLTLANTTFNTTFNQTSAANWKWANITAATSGASQSSPIVNISGQYWTGAASAEDKWTLQDVIANGTNGISTFTFAHSGSSGSSVVLVPSLSVGVSTTGWQRGTSTNNTFASDFVRTYSNTNNTGWSHGVNSSNIAVIASPNGHVAWTNNNNPSGSATTVGITNQTTTATQLNVYQNMYNRDTLGFLGFQGTPNGISIAALATPAAPTVTVAQGSGATTWGYKVVAKDGSGATIASSEGTVANNATLNGNSVPATNKVLITRVNGASSYDVYRTTVGTSPNTSGLIGNISDAGTTFQVAGASSTTVGAYFVNDFGSNSAVSTVFAPSGTTSQYNCTNLSIGNNNGCAGLWITIAGCVASNNNGRFFCLKSNSGQLFLINPSATAAAGQSGTATVVGDGTVPPSVGLNTAGGINFIPPTSAIPGGVAYSSGLITLGGYYFNGSGVGTDSWTIQNAIGPLTNDSSLLELLHSGTPGTAGVLIGNTSFTTAIANSPYLILGGSYEVSASLNTFAEDNWYFQNVIGAGANGTSTLNITHTGTSGVSKVKVPALSLTGILYDSTGSAGSNTNILTSTGTGTLWSSGANATQIAGKSVSTVTPLVGDTLRYNEWGDSKWDVCIGAPFVRGWYADIFNASILGLNAGTNPVIGTGSALARVAPTATESVMQGNATSGTASTSVTCYIAWQAGGVNPFAFGSVKRMSTRVQFLHTANVRYFLGLFSNAATPAVSTGTDTPNMHYAAFRYSAGTDTTIQAICGTATASLTVVDTGVAVDTTASHVFDIAYDGTNVNFFIDGVLKAQISTNLPSTSDTVQPSLMCDNKNTNNAVGWRFAWMVIAPK